MIGGGKSCLRAGAPDAEAEQPDEPVSDAKEYTEGDWKINDNGELLKYSGSAETVTIPSSINGITVTSLKGTFCYNKTAKVITVPNTVKTIGYEAFHYCYALTTVNLPSSVTEIGEDAFSYSQLLTQIVLPDGVKSIGREAFESCTGLASVNFGKSLETIGYEAFYSCTYLNYIELPNTVKTLDSCAFQKCTKLAVVELSNSLETIGDYAFDGDSDLLEIVIPASVTSIGTNAFGDCNKLASVEFKGGGTIGGGAFINCWSLTSLTFTSKIKVIGKEAFCGCGNLETITFENGIELIGDYAFSEDFWPRDTTFDSSRCQKIKKIVLPNSLKNIGKGAFDRLINLSSVTLGSGLETIGEYAFCGTAIKTINLPDKVTTISDYCFADCASLESIHFGSRLNTIGSYCFDRCTKLKNVYLPDSVAFVKEYAFSNCTSLQSFTTGKLMTSLRNNTFKNDTSLKTLTFPNYISSIGDTVFNTCSGLSDIYYIGTITEWERLMKINSSAYLAQNVNNYIIHCIDGIYNKGTKTTLTVSSVAISTTPAKTKYYVDDVADVEGGYIRVTFSDGSTVTVAMTTSMLVDFDTSTSGTKIVTVKYGEKTTSYTITVSEPEIESIYVSGFPTTANYGYELNLSSAVITITYSDGSSREAAVTANMVSGYNKDKLGAQTVTVTYSGKIWSTTVTVKEISVSAASLLSAPTKRSYLIGDALEAEGGVISVTYTDGTTEMVTITAAMITGYNSSKEGTQTLTISYEGFSWTYNVTVVDPNALPNFSHVLVVDSNRICYDVATLNKAIKLARDTGLECSIYIKEMEKEPALTFVETRAPITINIFKQKNAYILTNNTTLNIKGDLIINCPIKNTNNKPISFKVAKNKTLTLNVADNYGTFSGSKGSKLNIGADITTDGIKTFDNVSSGSSIITIKPKGTFTAAPVSVAHLNFPLSLAKKVVISDVTEMLTVTISDAVTSGTQIFTYSGKGSLDPDKVIVTNKDGSEMLKAFSYKKVVRAEIPDVMTLNGKDCPTWEYAVSQITDAKTAYTLTVNKPITYAKFALPAKALSLTINGLGNTINTVKVKAITAKYDIILNNVNFTAGGADVALNAGKFNITLNNSTVGAVTTTGKLTLKGSVMANGAVSAAELCGSGISDLTAQSLVVTKSGITAGSDVITLKLIDKKTGAALKFTPGTEKKPTVIIKTFKLAKDTEYVAGSLKLSSECGSGTLAFFKNKIVLV